MSKFLSALQQKKCFKCKAKKIVVNPNLLSAKKPKGTIMANFIVDLQFVEIS